MWVVQHCMGANDHNRVINLEWQSSSALTGNHAMIIKLDTSLQGWRVATGYGYGFLWVIQKVNLAESPL